MSWRTCVRSSSRAGPGACRRQQPLTALLAGLRALVRFHETHPDWFPGNQVGRAFRYTPPPLEPEWEAALARAYRAVPAKSGVPPGSG